MFSFMTLFLFLGVLDEKIFWKWYKVPLHRKMTTVSNRSGKTQGFSKYCCSEFALAVRVMAVQKMFSLPTATEDIQQQLLKSQFPSNYPTTGPQTLPGSTLKLPGYLLLIFQYTLENNLLGSQHHQSEAETRDARIHSIPEGLWDARASSQAVNTVKIFFLVTQVQGCSCTWHFPWYRTMFGLKE